MARKAENTLPLNSQAVATAKAIGGKQTEFTIEGARGLKLVVLPTGTATYMFSYTAIVDGKSVRNKIKVGRRDGTSLHDARKKVDEYRRQIDNGIDPAAEHERVKAVAAARANAKTLRQLFEDRCAKDSVRTAITMTGYRIALENDVFPSLGDLPAAEITADQIARVLEVVEQRSKWQAHKARSALGGTYKWAIKRRVGGIRINPVTGLGFTFQGKARNRLPTPAELALIWKKLDSGSLSKPMQIIMKLAILTPRTSRRRSPVRVDQP
jgi:hypothetical protein